MPSKKEQIVLDAFLAVAGDGWRGVGASELLDALGSEDLQALPAGAAESNSGVMATLAGSYTQVLQSSPVYRAVTQGSSEQGTLARVASAVFENALGMVPLARAVMGLFGGDKEETTTPLIKYALPPRLSFDAASGPQGSLLSVDYGQEGLPRAYSGARAANTPAEARAAEVTIQVQAMDSRSFLDHKEEIAQAVREAMLNMHSLNDVVSDL